ncbi:hypothetical protein BB561_000040 [Smittium simulii]|uniref:Retrotransposon gag domain-containing protein n=1 Tax=Smittium simulii TaxID=133385 RepID=A0A2T9Z0S6_9FUNG|nr:hypothetical protein BB561_000040 [Smittium simulii]
MSNQNFSKQTNLNGIKLHEIKKFSENLLKYNDYMAAIKKQCWSRTDAFNEGHNYYNWFIQEFKKNFSDESFNIKATNKLMKFYQDKQSVFEYYANFRSLAIEMNIQLSETLMNLIDKCIDSDICLILKDSFKNNNYSKFDSHNNIEHKYIVIFKNSLSPEEGQRRINNKLCLFCGDKSHVLCICPIRPKDLKFFSQI